MTRAAYAAIVIGVLTMVLLSIDPAYEAAHRWGHAVLWACQAFFAFEWLVRLRYALRGRRVVAYLVSP
ncbi:MAG: cyclic nucleotide-binding protein, partial [Bradyrhizobium sp.]|nr:cyclic nucleotide-binding protein [Bradyrhizobium sp.]